MVLRIAVAAAIIFQHFTVVLVAGYPVTLGAVIGVVLVMYSLNRAALRMVVVGVLVLAVLLPLATMLTLRFSSVWSYLPSFALTLLAGAIYLAGLGGTRLDAERRLEVWRGTFAALVITAVVSVLQVAAGTAGSTALFNLFGARQYRYQYQPNLQFNPIPRAQGFYLEPSYDAFVIGSCAVALVVAGYRRMGTMIAAVAGLLASQSATGLVLMGLIALMVAVKSRASVKLALGVMVVPAAVLVAPYLVDRLASVTQVGSSGNYRVLAPLPILADILAHYPLGLPVGSIDVVVPQYGLVMNGKDQAVSIDTGFYVVIYYFGWLGVLMLLGALIWAVASYLQQWPHGRELTWVAPVWVVCALSFSGAVIAPEFALMLWLPLLAWRSQIDDMRREEVSDDRARAAVGGGGDLQGP